METKGTYKKVYLKDFVISDGSRTRSLRKAQKAIKSGLKVQMNVHVGGKGEWKTSEVESIHQKTVETANHFYQIVGYEPVRRAKEVQVLIPIENKLLTTNKKDDVLKLADCIKRGCQLKAKVIYKNGGISLTTPVVRVNSFLRQIVTQSGSIYHW